MNPLFPIAIGEKHGFIDREGQLVIDPTFSWAGAFNDGLAPVSRSGKFGFIDLSGMLQVALIYDSVAAFFRHNRAYVRLHNQWGFIDKHGHMVTAPQYSDVGFYAEEKACVCKDEVWGIIDLVGHLVVEHLYDETDFFSCGMVRVVRHGRFLFLNHQGQVMSLSQYRDSGRRFSEDRVHVQNGQGKWGFVDVNGIETVECRYDGLSMYHDGYAVYYDDGEAGYFDHEGRLAFGGSRFEQAVDFSDGCAPVKDRGKWYLQRVSGDRIGPIECESLSLFRNGFSMMIKDDKCGFLDRNGQIVVAPEYEWADDFDQGLARVEMDGRSGYVNTSGQLIWPPQS